MWAIYNQLKLPKDLIEVERDGCIFQVDIKCPFSPFRYKGRKKQRVTVGHKYSLGTQFVTSHAGMDSIDAIQVGEKVVWGHDWMSLLADKYEARYDVGEGWEYEENLAYLRSTYPAEIIKDSNTGPAATQHSSEDASQNTYWLAQTFTTASEYSITAVGLSIWRNNGYPGVIGDITVSIKATDDDGHPTGDDLCFVTLDAAVFPDVSDYEDWTIVQFNNPCILNTGTKYAIVVRLEQRITGRWFNWQRDTTDKYAGGNLETSVDYGTTWIADILYPTRGDCLFKTYTRKGYAPNHQISIWAGEIFGGKEKEGGIEGKVDLLFGASDQAQNDYLVSRIDSDIPAYRGMTSLVLRQVYIGTSPYLKPWSFLCKRATKLISGDIQWYPEKAVINPRVADGDDINAAHIIRECLTDKEFGSGWDADADIDDVSFRAAADTLYNEGFGLSLLWDQVQPMEEFIGNILSCIAGFLYQDLESGKWVLSLTRPSNIEGVIISNTEAIDGGTIFESSILTRHSGFALEQYQVGQTFIATSNFDTDKIQLLLHTVHNMTVRLEVQGVKDDDYYGTIYKIPNGNVLAYGEVTEADIQAVAGWTTFNLNKKLSLVKGQTYAFIFYVTASDLSAYLYYDYDSWAYGTALSNIPNGSYVSSSNYGGIWGINGTADILGFRILKAEVETYNESDIIDIEDLVRSTPGEITNLVTVNWWDKVENKTRPAEADDIALIKKQQGRIVPLILNMYGLGNATIAAKVADRELKLASSMLASVRLKCTRTMAHLKPNQVFRLSWNEYNITNMLLRVLEINYGNLSKNEITIDCLEELETETYAVSNAAPANILPDITNDPIDVVDAELIEIPYWILCNEFENQEIIDGYSTTAGFLIIAAIQPISDSYNFEYRMRITAALPYNPIGVASWCPSATIETDMYMEADDITVDITDITNIQEIYDSENEMVRGGTGGFPTKGTYAIIGNEIIKVLTVDEVLEQIEIARGVLDTAPEFHTAGAPIYFIGAITANEIIPTMFSDGDVPDVKLLTQTIKRVLSVDEATAISADALGSRIIRPYLPANLKFNIERFPTFLSSKAASKFTITWNHRDRTDITQLETIVEHTTASDYGPEAGTTYTIKVYDEDNVLRRTVTGLSVKTYDYTHAFEISDCGSLQSQLRFVIYSVRDGFDSFQNYDVLIKRSFVATTTPTATLSGSLEVVTPMSSSSLVATSGADATMQLPDLFGFSFDTTATATGYIEIQRDLIAASATLSSIDGPLDRNQNLVSASIGAVTTTGAFDRNQNLVSAVDSTSVITGPLDGNQNLVSTIDSPSAITGPLYINQNLVSTIAATSAITGAMAELASEA